MSEGKVRLGVIGAGNIGNVHMSVFSQLKDEAVLAAVTDDFRPLAEKAAKEYAIDTIHESAEQLIQDDKVDAVIIGVPNAFHAPLAIQALKAGKHVLLEKPMGINGEAAKEIVRVQRESGNVLMVGHQMRWQWQMLEMKRQMDLGAIGDVYNAKTGWWRRKGIPGWGTWFTQKEISGGGPLIDIGVHMLDLALSLMGDPKPVSVYGSTYAAFGPKKKGIGTWGKPNWNGHFDVEDLATALIKMDNGATLSLEVSWAVNMASDNQPFVHLMGSEGGASLVGDRCTLVTEKFDRAIDIDLVKPEGQIEDRLLLSKHFLECIREGKEPITSAMTGLKNNLVLDAICESSKTGHEVTIDWEI
ncbi:Gfo/Idh/MocA family oxidoreductase [Pullulanibacillus sp. KACC 23026]|uniref:Gfo/Idh/MocA family protein n=1 Tax=Pullulanibacillus sp. KACC 23026 TaxID=3028315 RepID=UPI0023B1D661|nr:Gfo/Idh/MocA family oxidoreductase [Pullulanibacillus sp. KACC 23026]WEG12579.1 Gfo/Idh/MocA family oxidoreductase [Pullulanibacillus sp. KACC 23026]